jgi:DNA polymerase elongation subunit (family B)
MPLDPELIAEHYAVAGSIRGAASSLGYDEKTLREWAQKDERIRRVLYPDRSVPEVMKILALDIETRPNIAMVWDLWQRNVPPSAVTEATAMICWAAKWIGDPKIVFRSTFHDGRDSMIDTMYRLLDEADAVVHYNGQKFDIPYINMEFVRLGLGPPSPYQQIDLLKVVRKCFNFPSNKLALVSKELGLPGKIENEGFPLWIKCMADEPEAWKRMKSYNIRDTELLEDLYFKLRPWAASLPSYGAMTGGDVCPACGSTRLQARGFQYAKTARYQRYQCQGCGKWSRATKRSSGTGITTV